MQRKIDDQTRLDTVSQAAPSEAPTLARVVAPRKAWRLSGAAAGVIALSLGLAGCGGGSDNNEPPEEPAPAPAPGPGPGPAPAPAPEPGPGPAPAPEPAPEPIPAGFAKTGEVMVAGVDVGDAFTDSTNTRKLAFDAVNNRYYELKTAAAPISWADAGTAAATAGGVLASPSDVVKMAFVKQAFGALLPLGPAASGKNGAWIGLQQAASSAAKDAGWTFLDTVALPPASPLWNAGEPNDGGSVAPTDVNVENFGAIFAGPTADDTDLKMIYDAGETGSTDTQTMYLMEFPSKEAVK